MGLFLFSCKEKEGTEEPEEYCPGCDPCQTYREWTQWGPKITPASVNRFAPCFNASNANEFIYVDYDSILKKGVVNKYDLLKQSYTPLFYPKRGVLGLPKWGKNGWIVYGDGENIFKVKDNGDSLTQLTFNTEYQYMDPDVFGDKIIFTVRSGPINNLGSKIIDMNGKQLDSIPFRDANSANGLFLYNSMNAFNELAATNNHDLVTYNLTTKKLVRLVDDTGYKERLIVGACWHPNNTDIYFIAAMIGDKDSTRIGINKINKYTLKETRVKNVCSERAYYYMNISPDGKKIVVERENWNLLPDGSSYLVGSDIYIMDIDGRNERKVFP